MRLGSALATIRFNDVYQGVKKVFESLGVTPSHHLDAAVRYLDNIRVAQGSKIISNQQKRFSRKLRRGKKVRKQVEKHGIGYSSGKYSGAFRVSESASHDETPVVPPTSTMLDVPTSSAATGTEDWCLHCLRRQ